MISATDCKTYAAECQQLGMVADISMRRATVLMGMATSLAGLANQIERYDAIVNDEVKVAASVGGVVIA
jgi:hypothetical protein